MDETAREPDLHHRYTTRFVGWLAAATLLGLLVVLQLALRHAAGEPGVRAAWLFSDLATLVLCVVSLAFAFRAAIQISRLNRSR